MIQSTGATILNSINTLGSISILATRTLRFLLTGNFRSRMVFEQMVHIGYESIPVALVTATFVGMVFAVQIAHEFVKFGAGNVVGGIMAVAVARELAPALTGVVIGARIGASIAAEIGTMKVTEQIDAIEALASSPVKYLVVPRFIACTLMIPILTVFADLVGFIGGYLIAVLVVGINPAGYMDSASALMDLTDVFGGLAKTFVFGMLISLIACHYGLAAEGGARGVGQATTRSVVSSLVSIFVVNYFLSVAFFK